MPIYASPEQFMRDRSDYARKGIARGRSVVVTTYAGGVLFVAENHSPSLHKVSEIYDRLGFAAAGRYNEYENLRTAGIRLADVRGYSYDRQDVTGRWLANAYAQTLGSIFSEHPKPYEVGLCVAEVGALGASDQLYLIAYDGSIADETTFVVMGGTIEPVVASLKESFTPGWNLETALRAAVAALGAGGEAPPRDLTAAQLEVAILDRYRTGRTFRRVAGPELDTLLAATAPEPEVDPSGEANPAAAADQVQTQDGESVDLPTLGGQDDDVVQDSADPQYPVDSP